ncbi:DUF6680 family protein [Sphingomonas agrestis]|uniref:DUF6680 family protein n=1 Tax=Sphingomonas agrestis TaxID=3080540 RepID=UPI00374DA55D
MDPPVLAATLSAVAAIAAAIATWRGPLSAARMAESLRRGSEAAADSRRFRLNVFASLMQERAEIYSPDAVRALNSIDVAFSDSIAVREAWSELYQSLTSQPSGPSHVIDERLRKLLKEMAADLGIADKLRLDDLGRVYFPNVMAEERKVRDLERGAALARLSTQTSPQSNVADPTAALFPPKPE